MMLKRYFKKIFPRSVLNFRHLFYAWYGAVKYNHPSEELFVIGVTGTSGKSSTVYLLRQLLEEVGFKVGALSTIEFYVAGKQKLNDKKMTMLGKMEIQKYLREMADKECNIAIVETTSEGALQYRHRFINYDLIVLTNLYPEHIESHGSFINYKNAKLKVFKYISKSKRKDLEKVHMAKVSTPNEGKIPKTIIANANNEYTEEFLDLNFDQKVVFGRKDKKVYFNKNLSLITYLSVRIRQLAEEADHLSDQVGVEPTGLDFTIENRKFHVSMYGEHNISNILAVIAVARCLSIPWDDIQKAVNKFKPVPGRIEFIPEAEKHGFQVIVDYAFEPVALTSLYKVVELLKPKRVIHVCGSTGGGRDKARRIPIGKLVGKRADIFIVTDEDPYDEDPMEIINTVAKGAEAVGKKEGKDMFKVLARRKAIEKAISLAKEGDLVLVTGKGSEQAMCVAGGKMAPWDDRVIVRDAIEKFYH